MFKLLFASSRSLTFELINDSIYYSPQAYDVFLNGIKIRSKIKSNVFSLFELYPDTEYSVLIGDYSLHAKTLSEFATVNVKEFGAKGDSIANDTQAIQAAINACPAHGRVLLEKGTFLAGPLFLKSDLTIEIDQSAKILGDTIRTNYPILPGQIALSDQSFFELSSWEGKPNPTFASLITGINVQNVNIIGEGVIDANAQNGSWWNEHKIMHDGAYRPKGIFFSHCENIHLQGLTIMNTPSWNLHPYFSSNLGFFDLKLVSPKDSPNTDGCNPESCSDVSIIGVDFSVGDDCIAIKSGKFDMGMRYGIPSERITIRNCHMAYGHGAVVLGSEMSGGIRDLTVKQCYFENTDRGLRIKTRRGRGKNAVIDGIIFENIYMSNVLTPFVMNMYYYCDDDGKTEYVWSKAIHPVDDKTPYLGKFTFRNVICKQTHVCAGFFYGLPETPIESITFENVEVEYARDSKSDIPAMMSFLKPMSKHGLEFRYVNNVVLRKVKIIGSESPPVLLENVKSFIEE